MLIVNDEQRL